MSSVTRAEPGWTVVLPMKGGPAAKSRLGAPAALATAIALDCLEAVLAAGSVDAVVVVTPDLLLATEATAAGAQVRPESNPGAGLLAAVADGLVGVIGPCAVLLGDLPALTPGDLDTALGLARGRLQGHSDGISDSVDERTDHGIEDDGQPASGAGSGLVPSMVFVPDAEGTGTVLLTALDPAALRPSFGPGSAAAHQTAGALRLAADLPRLRRDVDTPDDLRTAIALGVGVRTRAVLGVGV